MLKLLTYSGLAFALGTAVAVAEGNDVEIIRPPQPVYPYIAAAWGIEGYCEARFDLLAGGTIVSVQEIACTHPVFCTAARDAILSIEAHVIDVPGAEYPGQRLNLVYPLAFKITPEERDWPAGEPCTSDLVS